MHFQTETADGEGLHTSGTNGFTADLETDIVVVGAGFGGIYLLHKLRDEYGYDVKIFEVGEELGGVWHWNCYPGARVDSMVPVYELSIEKLWRNWNWTEKYPDYTELRKYFEFVEEQLDIKKDVFFRSKVVHAQFDKSSARWIVKTEEGRIARSKFFICCTGFAAKRHFPDWPGLEKFQGAMHHSSFWPNEGVDVTGKRVAVIGTGSTGIQIAQETAKAAKSVTVFQRTPNLCLPMRQQKLTVEEQEANKTHYPELYNYRLTTFSGFPMDFVNRKTFDDTAEEREKFFEDLWSKGGFHFWLGTYKDMLFDETANDEAWNFWLKKTRARITDPKKRELLAPLQKPHPWGTKRPSLEQNFYEMMDQPQNEIVDAKKTPVVEVTEKGLKTSDGQEREFDVIALATGFDGVTGGMKNMGLVDVDGKDINEKWKNGLYTGLGMTLSGFPNFFYLYGAHGPTAFSNGPSCVECQADWIIDALAKMKREGISYIDSTKESEKMWREKIEELSKATLFHNVDSWYMGANIPGKVREQLSFAGGFPMYIQEISKSLYNGFEGFITV